jgi:hypothetical protein
MGASNLYFQLRSQEVRTEMETFLQAPLSPADPEPKETLEISHSKNDRVFVLRVFSQVWQICLKIWKSPVFLWSVSHRFLRLSFQVLLRINLWIKEALEANNSNSNSNNSTSSSNMGINTISVNQNFPANVLSGLSDVEWLKVYSDAFMLHKLWRNEYLNHVIWATAETSLRQDVGLFLTPQSTENVSAFKEMLVKSMDEITGNFETNSASQNIS